MLVGQDEHMEEENAFGEGKEVCFAKVEGVAFGEGGDLCGVNGCTVSGGNSAGDHVSGGQSNTLEEDAFGEGEDLFFSSGGAVGQSGVAGGHVGGQDTKVGGGAFGESDDEFGSFGQSNSAGGCVSVGQDKQEEQDLFGKDHGGVGAKGDAFGVDEIVFGAEEEGSFGEGGDVFGVELGDAFGENSHEFGAGENS